MSYSFRRTPFRAHESSKQLVRVDLRDKIKGLPGRCYEQANSPFLHAKHVSLLGHGGLLAVRPRAEIRFESRKKVPRR